MGEVPKEHSDQSSEDDIDLKCKDKIERINQATK